MEWQIGANAGLLLVGPALEAIVQGNLIHATRLLGASEILSRAAPLEGLSATYPKDIFSGIRKDHQQALSEARSRLDEATFAVAWEAGRAMTLEQAVQIALEGKDAAGLGT